MWMPRSIRKRLERLADVPEDASARSEHADMLLRESRLAAARSAAIARRSAELTDINGIAAILAGSLKMNNGEHRERGKLGA